MSVAPCMRNLRALRSADVSRRVDSALVTWCEQKEYGSCNLDLGSVWNDPRGTYSCRQSSSDSSTSDELFIDVYVRKCQNCIELDAGTICGFLIADFIMIGLIAMAVYFVSGSETRRPGRASDKQNLIDRDQEYQELGLRRNEEYSQLAGRKRNAI
ncbi:PREDICTED: T-cell surface glycoprotein CD3 gamma chain [Nanorana parkeri]|uniref:T-cell surface glycoprotein CD3 gamma chain n=1 Tax=Nanorana parkeri TaxID=125878 RepID=UPI0008550509|nr:PREDICTED: T-cell surface glycoprotein CD3 gamma chain [Nanorana parkeri]